MLLLLPPVCLELLLPDATAFCESDALSLPSDDPCTAFRMRLASIRGLGWAEQLLAQLAL